MPQTDPRPDLTGRVRGLVVGYCLGDALGRAPETAGAPLLAGTPSMLFLSGVEGVIRALVAEHVTGRADALADACWHATARWAHRARRDHLRGVQQRRADHDGPWPDGWLADVAVLRGGRGSAPAVEDALDLPEHDPRPGDLLSDSVGDLVLSRTLPVALLAAAGPGGEDEPAGAGHRISAAARDVAAYSHGLDVQVIAVALTRTLAQTLVTGRVQPLVDLADLSAVYRGVPHADDVVRARVALRALADLMPPTPRATDDISHGIPSGTRTALGATREGLRCALAHPGRDEVGDAIAEFAPARHPAAAAVTLALLGAAHGIESLPRDAVERLDVGEVADRLALDLVAQVEGTPLASPTTADDWLRRYPPT